MRKAGFLMGAFALATSVAADASPPMPAETVATIEATLAQCTGGWYVTGTQPWRLIGPSDLKPRLALLARPSVDLEEDAASDLYAIGKALLVPAIDAPAWMIDRGSSLKCPARPDEAVALLEYLAGEGLNDWGGIVNTFDWLGFVHETGAVGAADPTKARRFYLRSHIHSAIPRDVRWSDGIDEDVLANIDRAGLRAYFDELAHNERYGASARMILAEKILPTDPAAARRLLLNRHAPSLIRLLELEEAGRVPTVADANDIAFWAEAWRSMLASPRWAERMLKGARLVNGGAIPTSSARPAAAELRPNPDDNRLGSIEATRFPLPVRALVDPEGRAIFVETCREAPLEPGTRVANQSVRMDAVRVYDPRTLPRLPAATEQGRPVYSWVILPAVHFQRIDDDTVAIRFADLPPASCAHSDRPDAVPPRAP